MPNTSGLNRTLGGAIGVIALVTILSSGAVLVTRNQLQSANEALAHSGQVIRALDRFRAAMLNQETGLRGYLITGREGSLEPYRSARPAQDDAIRQLRSEIGTDAERGALLADAVTAARTWQADIGEAAIRRAADPATRSEALDIEADGKGKAMFDTLRAKLAAIESLEERTQAMQRARVLQAERDESVALWGGTLITLLICAGIGLAVNRLIVRPLVRVMAFVERVGEGDLAGRLEAGVGGEVGRLSGTLNAMVSGLSDL
ncbi:CHASE3 domain-containing protein, partial [Methylobacterium longum]